MKKTTSLLLALIMIFALAIPALADDSVAVAGEAVAPKITVTMPTGVVLGLNPYKMKYAGSTAFFKNEKGSQAQIISPIAVIENKSDVKLDVLAIITATATDTIEFVDNADAAATSDTNDAKTVYLTVQVGEASDKTGTSFKTTPTKAVMQPQNDTYKSIAYYGKDDSNEVISGDDASGGTMKAISIAPTDGKTANYIGFKFDGAAATAPDTSWDENDKIDVSVVFTFKPVVLDVANA